MLSKDTDLYKHEFLKHDDKFLKDVLFVEAGP